MSLAQGLSLSVAKEFSDTPGPRARDEGDFSGEEFLERILLPRFEQARRDGVQLLVDLDGAEGYATSFLEASFGELARKYEPEDVLSVLRFKSEDEPLLVKEIEKYIREARKK